MNKYKNFKEFIVRTPINFVTILAVTLLSIFMLAFAIAIKDILNTTLFWVGIILFSILPFIIVLITYFYYITDKNKVKLMNELPNGWWLQISPLARIENEQWIVGVLRKGKQSWITESCKSGFDTPQEAYEWGKDFIKNNK